MADPVPNPSAILQSMLGPDIVKTAKAAVMDIITHGADTFRSMVSGVPLPQPPSLEPVDPKTILEDIGTAVANAEKALGTEHLLVAGGTVEVEFFVKLPGEGGASKAGARTTIAMTIAPKPQ